MNLEWSVPHRIVSRYSTYGDLLLNVADSTTGRIYRIQPDTYKIVPSLRVTQDNISQADGSVLHTRWKTGVTAFVQVALDVMIDPSKSIGEARPACENEMREMAETLLLHLNSMKQLSPDPLVNQRLEWTPASYGGVQRLIDSVQLLEIWDPTYDLGGEEALIAFALESPFPYGIDAPEIDTAIAASGTAVIHNAGNCPQSPVVIVNGPFSGFTITNADDTDSLGTALKVVYDGTRPGAITVPGGHFAEIDFFRGTIYLDGASTNMIAGIDPTQTDFWFLNPYYNHVTITGAGCTVKSNNAWA